MRLCIESMLPLGDQSVCPSLGQLCLQSGIRSRLLWMCRFLSFPLLVSILWYWEDQQKQFIPQEVLIHLIQLLWIFPIEWTGLEVLGQTSQHPFVYLTHCCSKFQEGGLFLHHINSEKIQMATVEVLYSRPMMWLMAKASYNCCLPIYRCRGLTWGFIDLFQNIRFLWWWLPV